MSTLLVVFDVIVFCGAEALPTSPIKWHSVEAIIRLRETYGPRERGKPPGASTTRTPSAPRF